MSMMQLVLQDGTVLRGRSFGAERAVAGEVVFSTGMTGYVESLTDPSYRGQILTLTYPLQGNYGVPAPRDRDLLLDRFESGRVQPQGLVVQRHSDVPSHHEAAKSLGDWLKEQGVPAIEGVTRKLREFGTMAGWLLPDGVPLEPPPQGTAQGAAFGQSIRLEEAKKRAEVVDMRTATQAVSVREPVRYEAGPLRVMVVDTGAKDSIVRGLHARGATVLRVPATARLSDFIRDVDGVLLANGPGDPKDNEALIEQIRTVLFPSGKPVFGVCLGNQLLALAAGGDTIKLKYGHRSHNQPVQDLLTRRCYVTSQNHGYVVRDDSLPEDWEPWFVNVNDGSNEGIFCRSKPWSSVQFHPEAAPGPEDAGFLFDDFLRRIGSSRV
jgi:carbamoyl-phosphate synthase small subunit